MRHKKSELEQKSALSQGVLAFLLTLGIALVVSAVLGCIGALRENVRILYVVSLRHFCFFDSFEKRAQFRRKADIGGVAKFEKRDRE